MRLKQKTKLYYTNFLLE